MVLRHLGTAALWRRPHSAERRSGVAAGTGSWIGAAARMKRRPLLLAAPLLAAGVARAQTTARPPGNWPERPVRLVVPFAPGGPSDIVARALAQRLSPALGQPVVVENRAGGGGVVGTDAVAKAPPDGHTIGLCSAGALAIAPSLMPNMPYETLRDLAPVTLGVKVAEILAVAPSLPV